MVHHILLFVLTLLVFSYLRWWALEQNLKQSYVQVTDGSKQFGDTVLKVNNFSLRLLQLANLDSTPPQKKQKNILNNKITQLFSLFWHTKKLTPKHFSLFNNKTTSNLGQKILITRNFKLLNLVRVNFIVFTFVLMECLHSST